MSLDALEKYNGAAVWRADALFTSVGTWTCVSETCVKQPQSRQTVPGRFGRRGVLRGDFKGGGVNICKAFLLCTFSFWLNKSTEKFKQLKQSSRRNVSAQIASPKADTYFLEALACDANLQTSPRQPPNTRAKISPEEVPRTVAMSRDFPGIDFN